MESSVDPFSLSRAALTIKVRMSEIDSETKKASVEFYCPQCRVAVDKPLVCGDCMAVICRECGTVLERVDDLGVG
jgi:hypothetical protein